MYFLLRPWQILLLNADGRTTQKFLSQLHSLNLSLNFMFNNSSFAYNNTTVWIYLGTGLNLVPLDADSYRRQTDSEHGSNICVNTTLVKLWLWKHLHSFFLYCSRELKTCLNIIQKDETCLNNVKHWLRQPKARLSRHSLESLLKIYIPNYGKSTKVILCFQSQGYLFIFLQLYLKCQICHPAKKFSLEVWSWGSGTLPNDNLGSINPK